jgi:hypothetical protein
MERELITPIPNATTRPSGTSLKSRGTISKKFLPFFQGKVASSAFKLMKTDGKKQLSL